MALSDEFTYTWEVTGLRVRNQVNTDGDTLTDAVVQTFWKLEGTDANGYTAIHQGATPFTAENVPAGEFVSFSSLTEETVLGWIQDFVNNDMVYSAHIVEVMKRDIDREHNIRDASMPWAPEESVTPTPGAPSEDELGESANTAAPE